MPNLKVYDFSKYEIPDNAIGISCGYQIDPPNAEVRIFQTPDDANPLVLTGSAPWISIPLTSNQLFVDDSAATTFHLTLQGFFKKTEQPPLVIEVSDTLLHAIGHLIAQWAYLESLVDQSIEKLGNQLQTPGLDNVLQREFKRRRRFWGELIQQVPFDAILTPKLLGLVNEIGSVESERHKLAHARWIPHETKDGTFTAFKDSPTRGFEWSLTTDRVEETGLKIAKINRALFYILQDFGAAQPPSKRIYEILGSLDLPVTVRHRPPSRHRRGTPKRS